VLDLQRDVLSSAVGAGAPPFFEQILPYLVAHQFALLALDPRDLGVLQQLRVDAHEFLTD
jgi:hypothetical protein